ncbi:DMT family transporter [Aeromonas sp. Marseille-Q5825]|uniref:DMT family transporter n=1 Tax=Aeromonas sp. Marseille-Q5825 TaxID=2972767 RepID=UPI0021C9292E|nr:DMT family transporter [Aeromonas sp. Marseille-Q5825]
MTILILLGLLNGVAVSLSRTLNGRLASARSAMTASLANHLLGFGLLGALLILKGAPWERLAGLDPWLLLGGVLGALFVAISSWAIGRIGALACALLIVAGQLLGGALLDALAGRLAASDLLGILLVLAGAALQRWQAGKPASRALRHEGSWRGDIWEDCAPPLPRQGPTRSRPGGREKAKGREMKGKKERPPVGQGQPQKAEHRRLAGVLK